MGLYVTVGTVPGARCKVALAIYKCVVCRGQGVSRCEESLGEQGVRCTS